MHSTELRQKFADFFKSKNHTEIPSASIIPDKRDPTVLLTTAGMQPLVPYLMGAKHPAGNRIFDTQKCFRTPDIEEVGDDTHHTMFEMLGNWSLGDYFKEGAIELAYDFFVNILGLDPKRFAITIFEGDKDAPRDDEAERIWLSKGLEKSQIFEFDKKDNFWGPAGKTGPCGPCSEIHYDRGAEYGEDLGPNCDDNQRYVEIWNLVFMEYNKKEDGTYEKLSQKNVDTGVGFERLLSILNKEDSAFDTDLFKNILTKIEKLSGKKYRDNLRSFRVIADHVRGATFLIADGVIPGNTGRDYVLRRIIRRAIMHGRKMGIEELFLSQVAQVVINDYAQFYPELKERQKHTFNVLNTEEEKFRSTLGRGEKMLSEALKDSKIVTGQKAFELFDTYGFPFELTKEIAEDKGAQIDEKAFQDEMEKQRERSRRGSKMFDYQEDFTIFENLPATEFLRDTTEYDGVILEAMPAKNEKNITYISLKKSPFYAESGGQVADIGIINNKDVLDVQKNVNNVFIHKVQGNFKKNAVIHAQIGNTHRAQVARHHSLAHLLQASLRKVLGNHIEQQGSEVCENRTRFDFSHPKNLSIEEVNAVEKNIIDWVTADIKNNTEELTIEDAQKKGAMALFSDKFEQGELVRVVSFGDISCELCGGTHIKNTAEIGAIKIISESSIATGIRRIEIICSRSAQELLQRQYAELNTLSKKLKTENVLKRLEKIMKERKTLEEQVKQYQGQLAKFEAQELAKEAVDTKSGKTLIKQTTSDIALIAKSLIPNLDIAIITNSQGSIAIATKNTNAKEILQKITTKFGGGGGGNENFAQGGGIKKFTTKEILTLL